MQHSRKAKIRPFWYVVVIDKKKTMNTEDEISNGETNTIFDQNEYQLSRIFVDIIDARERIERERVIFVSLLTLVKADRSAIPNNKLFISL